MPNKDQSTEQDILDNTSAQTWSEVDWDLCIVGNGVSSLWIAHWAWRSKLSTIWVTSTHPYSSDQALLQHAWLWGASPELAQWARSVLPGFSNVSNDTSAFSLAYYDARSARRFRKPQELKIDWGTHEKEFFQSTLSQASTPSEDLWNWHQKIHMFHDTGDSSRPGEVTCSSDGPQFVRLHSRPVLEILTQNHKISGVIVGGIASLKKSQNTIKAKRYILGDFDEYFPLLIQDKEDSQTLSQAMKGKAYQTGFGLKFWHKTENISPVLDHTLIMPLVVNPEKGDGSHVVGRFVQEEGKPLRSFWIGLLSDEDVEDNNEVLKKIKQTKRAVDRAIAGFADSIEREAVTFESRMVAKDLVQSSSKQHTLPQALGAWLITDGKGCVGALEQLKGVVEECKGSEGEFVHTLAENSPDKTLDNT